MADDADASSVTARPAVDHSSGAYPASSIDFAIRSIWACDSRSASGIRSVPAEPLKAGRMSMHVARCRVATWQTIALKSRIAGRKKASNFFIAPAVSGNIQKYGVFGSPTNEFA